MDTAKLLLEKTSSEEQKHQIIKNFEPKTLDTALHLAAQKNHWEFAEFLLSNIEVEDKLLIVCSFHHFPFVANVPSLSWNRQTSSALRITKAILEKVSENEKLLKEMLSMKCDDKLLAINYAIGSTHKNNAKCTKIIIPYYSDSDVEHIFLPCLELGDMDLARRLVDQIRGVNDELLERMMKAEDNDGYNCYHLVCKNGQFECLKWLLSLNDENDDEKKEDEDVCACMRD